jgi:hypothetical protein
MQGILPFKTSRALVALLLVIAALVNVDIIEPRVNVRWVDGVAEDERLSLERRFGLESAEWREGTTWRYVLRDRSRDNIAALIAHPAVDDTHDIDRAGLIAPDRRVQVSIRGWQMLVRAAEVGLFQVQSLILLLCGSALLWAAARDGKLRRRTGAAVLVAAAVMAFTVPLSQPIAMGDSETYTTSRRLFEQYAGVRQIRSEAHLSWAILGRLDAWYGHDDESPARALRTLTHGGTLLFFIAAVGVASLERWSPLVLRYLSLALLAPAALLYFGYQELGYLSLNLGVFPLLARGLRTNGRMIEATGVLSGVGAALHGFGLLSIAGAGLATLGWRATLMGRVRRALRLGTCGVFAYLWWIPLYALVLHLPLAPGHADSIPLRAWLSDGFSESRVNVAILSALGARDLLFSAWVAGVPLIGVTAALWRRYPDEVRAALLYSIPSTVFLVVFWPVQGLGVEIDLVLAAFPALYALAWVCAHDAKATTIAAALLASAHLAFWRIVLGGDFVNPRIH